MGLVDILIIVIVAAILGFAAWYIYKAKKNGRKCIGCPNGAACGGQCCGDCGGCSGSCNGK